MPVPDKVRSVGKHVDLWNIFLTVVEQVGLHKMEAANRSQLQSITDTFNCKNFR